MLLESLGTSAGNFGHNAPTTHVHCTCSGCTVDVQCACMHQKWGAFHFAKNSGHFSQMSMERSVSVWSNWNIWDHLSVSARKFYSRAKVAPKDLF